MKFFQYLCTVLVILATVASCNTPTSSTSGSTAPATSPTAEQPMANGDFRKMPPTPGPAPEIKLGDFQSFDLDNGLEVVLVENHKLPRVSYQLFVDVPAHLEDDYAGAGDLLGDMLRRATTTKTKEQIDEEIDFIGANLNTSANGAFASTISKYKEQVMAMMADVVLNAAFPESEFAKIKSEAEANLQQELNDPGSIAARVRRHVVYGENHPYGELMTEETLGNITLPIVRDYYTDYFVPNRSYLVMVGDLTMEEAKMMAEKYFGNWEAKEVAVPAWPDAVRPEGTTVTFVPRPGAVQSNILISHPVDIEPGTKQAIRANILNTILGSGLSSRLNANLRETKAYTYGASSGINADPLTGSFRAGADVRNEVTDSAIVEFLYELGKISEEKVSEEELAVTKTRITGSFGRALERPQRIASFALNTIRYGLDRDFYPTYLQRVQESSANDVLEVAQMATSPENTHIIVVGDKAVADKLARFATSGKVNFVDANGRPLDMDGPALGADVTAASVVDKYVRALGGRPAMEKINNLTMTMETTVQGQPVQQKFAKSGNNKLSTQTTMMGMVVSDQRYNDGKAKMTQQGQTMPVDDKVMATMAEQAVLFPALRLQDKDNIQLEIEGTEQINGKPAVVLLVSRNGESERQYFDLDSGLRIRTVSQQGPATVTADYGDYREVDGVLFPYNVKITGMAPFPLDMKVTQLDVNTKIDDSLFSVE